MSPQGLVQPNNAILLAGEPQIHEYEVKTATTMYPGRLVMTDTNEWDIKVCTSAGAATCLGVLDVEATELVSTIYGAGDQARVLRGPIVVLLKKDSGGALAIGQKVIAADGGMIQTGVTAGSVVGIALQAIAKETKDDVLVYLTI